MTVREVTYYEVVCHEALCGRRSKDLGSVAAFPSAEEARDDWEVHGGWSDPDTDIDFCDRHIEAECEWCDSRAVGVRDGCPACGEHLRSEFPQEASNG